MKKLVNAFKLSVIPFFLGFIKQLKQEGKKKIWWYRKWIVKIHRIE